MDITGIGENLSRKTFAIRVFLSLYAKIKKIEVDNDDLLNEFDDILVYNAYDDLLGLSLHLQVRNLIFNENRSLELRNAYLNNTNIPPLNATPDYQLHFNFVANYLITQFFIGENLEPYENCSLGFRYIKKPENREMYYRFKHSIINEIEELIFNPLKAKELREKSRFHTPFQPHAKLLSPIKNMDFELFLQSYPNVKIYPPNSTNVFTRKLNNIFAILKSKGDTHLKIKNVTSFCKCGNCKNHPNKYIYAFVGNVSADYFALTMLINRDYEPHLIDMPLPIYDIENEHDDIDAYNETTKGQKFGELHTFKIWEDEYDNFIPTQEYYDFKELRHNAYNDLKDLNYKIETYDELKNWLTKYDKNKIKIVNKYESLVEFIGLYKKLENIAKCCIYIPQTDLAMSKLPVDYETNHDALVKWLIEFENLFIYELNDFSNSNDFFIYEFVSIITVNKDFDCEVYATIVGSIIPFLEVYKSYYYNELDRLRELYHSQDNNQLTAEEIENDFMCNELSYFYNLISIK